MDETLGKRISACRKRLGLTQDALADQLGVTAQAVSKWENDQSCPDISILPKLAAIFDTTTDYLLGLQPRQEQILQPVTEEPCSGGNAPGQMTWEFQLNSGRRGRLTLACWVLLVAGLLLAGHFSFPAPYFRYSFWDLLWTTGLLVFGLSGLYPRFSVVRFGCAFFGGYFLLERGGLLGRYGISTGLIFPIVLLMFGVGLLLDAFVKPQKGHIHISRKGHLSAIRKQDFHYDGETFACSCAFGHNHHLIQLPRLSGGKAEVSFGEMTVDLSGCESLSSDCVIQLEASFGVLNLLVPRQYRVELNTASAFGNVEENGTADPNASQTLFAQCDVNFGQIQIRYI